MKRGVEGGKGGRACKCPTDVERMCVCVGRWGRKKGRQGRRALEVESSSVAGGCDGRCKGASSRVAGAEVESIRSTGASCFVLFPFGCPGP